MFYHRVLPPPPNLAVPFRRSSLISDPVNPVSGSLDEDSMTAVADRAPFPYTDYGRSRNRSLREQEEQASQINNAARDSNLSSPISLRSSTRLSRKRDTSASPPPIPRQSGGTRLASISRDVPARDEDLTDQDSSHICLCQPDPKVPRPRNAFILFRQHHQAAVVSQNPGLANPDISKIIGDAWRTSSIEIKNHWKKLAEDEKVRHQKLYPDYRYQPRRAGRNSVSNSVTTDPDTQKCLKCGGKTMQTYNTLPTPGTPTLPRPAPPSSSMGGNTILSRGSRYIGSPSYPSSSVELRRFPPPMSSTSLSLRSRDPVSQMPPGAKRRRYDGPISPPQRQGSVVMPPSFSQSGRRPSLPHPEISTRGQNLSVSRPHPSSTHPIRSSGPALAPLQIEKSRDVYSQGKAVEAMVMSIPALNKIKVLAKISPPLPAPGPTSPPHETRGALIAVEGADEDAIKMTTNYLKEYLERDGDYTVRLLEKSIDTTFEDNASWIKTIRNYHRESLEIIKYITNFPSEGDPDATPTNTQTTRVLSDRVRKVSDPEDESMSSPLSSPSLSSTALKPFGRRMRSIPIIIAPRYQLSLTDLAASQIAINDEYSPTDHWQWMATLWRGIIGPDVTIDIRTPGFLHGGGSSRTPSPRNAGGTAPTTATHSRSAGESPLGAKDVNMTGVSSSSGGSGGAVGQISGNIPVVDVRLQDARAVFLRGEVGGRVSETGLRRMGFEVGEWLRDVESRERERDRKDRER